MEGQPSAQQVAPCFVGGSGRSGTTILGRLIGRHSAYGLVPVEAKFHSHPAAVNAETRRRPPSLLDLLLGRASLDAFVAALRTHWWSFSVQRKRPRGLVRFVPEDVFEAGIEAFQRGYPVDPWAAAGELIDTYFSVTAPRRSAWVEMSPTNIRAAKQLGRCLPAARFIHIVRDGRDVAASMVTRPWGQETWDAALLIWRAAVRRAEIACTAIPPERGLVVQLEDLVTHEREATYRTILDFLGVDDEPEMRAYFESQMNGQRAHTGRWSQGLEPAEIERREAAYRACLEAMAVDRPDGIGQRLLARIHSRRVP